MVHFTREENGIAVHVGEARFGTITKEYGFWQDSGTIRSFLKISSEDLREIARKAELEQGHVVCQCGWRASEISPQSGLYRSFKCGHCGETINVFRSEFVPELV